jgi:hypothetical protein
MAFQGRSGGCGATLEVGSETKKEAVDAVPLHRLVGNASPPYRVVTCKIECVAVLVTYVNVVWMEARG